MYELSLVGLIASRLNLKTAVHFFNAEAQRRKVRRE